MYRYSDTFLLSCAVWKKSSVIVKQYLLPILILLSLYTGAKDTTFYFNEHWRIVKAGSPYTYKRVILQADSTNFLVKDYYENDNLYRSGHYLSPDINYLKDARGELYKHDTFRYYYDDGSLKEICMHDGHKKTGMKTTYYKTSSKIKTQQIPTPIGADGIYYISYDEQVGMIYTIEKAGKQKIHKHYSREGILALTRIYERRNLVSEERTEFEPLMPNDEFDEITVYKLVEEMPQPAYNINTYLANNVRYPAAAKEQGADGRVIIKFIVDEEGYATEIVNASYETVHPALVLEAIRVVHNMPPWKPAMQDGIPVKVYYNLPIKFNLN